MDKTDNTASLNWENVTIPEMKGVQRYSATPFKDYIIIFGGILLNGGAFSRQGLYLDRVNLFDTKKNMLHLVQTGSPNPSGRGDHTACLYKNDRLIIFGGLNEQNNQAFGTPASARVPPLSQIAIMYLDSVELLTVRWEFPQDGEVNRNLYGRSNHTAHIYKDQMYVIGGLAGGDRKPTTKLQRLNLETFEWTALGDAPDSFAGHCSVLHQDKVFVYGGCRNSFSPEGQSLNLIYLWDLTTQTWAKINVEPRISCLSSMEIVNSSIYILGNGNGDNGLFDNKDLRDFHVYEIDNEKWNRLPIQGNAPIISFGHRLMLNQDKLELFGEPANSDFSVYSVDISSVRGGSSIHGTTSNENKNLTKFNNDSYVAQLKQLFLDKTYSDVTFCVQGEEIPAHKCILAMRCKHFANMFANSTEGSKIEISDIKLPTFKAVLEFVYCNQLELGCDLALDLLEASVKCSYPELKSVCEKFLASQLNLDNYASIAHASEQFDASLLRAAVVEFVIKKRQVLEQREDPGKLSKALLWEIVFKSK